MAQDESHAEVMAKYIIRAYRRMPGLAVLPNRPVYFVGEDGETVYDSERAVVPELSAAMKKIYGPEHPYTLAISEATGFTWGWAYNIARYALGLPPQQNPAIVTIGANEVHKS